MPKSSINIQPVKASSEAHNLRQTPLNYVRQDKTYENKSIIMDEIHPTRTRLQALVKEKTGRAMQKKATPIREGVVNMGPKNSMDDLIRMCGVIEEKLGVKTMQIHIHEDEGHTDKESGKWKQNRHAHVVFNWMDEETGKSIKLLRHDLSEMQNIVAEQLNLERGQSSDKNHLHAMEFKAQKKAEEARVMEGKKKEAKKDLQITKVKHAGENLAHELKKGFTETFKRLGKVEEARKLKEQLDGRKIRFEKLRDKTEDLEKKLERSIPLDHYDKVKEDNIRLRSELLRIEKTLEDRKEQLKLRDEHMSKILLGYDKDGSSREALRNFYEENGFHEKHDPKSQEKQEREINKRRGMGF